jgi:hypothetical protein
MSRFDYVKITDEAGIEKARQNAMRLELWIPNIIVEEATDDELMEYIQLAAKNAVSGRPRSK